MKKLLVFAIAILGFTAVSFGQNSSTENVRASASIITPLAVVKPAAGAAGSELKFGSIASAAAPGTVTISTASTPTRQVVGVTAMGTDFDNAKFTVTGELGMKYNVTLDANVTLTGPGADMNVVLNKSANNTGNALGDFYVGGVLTVGANQLKGDYAGTFAVTIAYQ